LAIGIRSAYKDWHAHHHHGPENNLQLEAGYICADCTSSKNLALQSGGGPYILGSFTTYVTINALVRSAREYSGPNEKLQRQCANCAQDLIRNMGAG
jgi:hypothetical protein